jgi:N-acetylneuraminate synthase
MKRPYIISECGCNHQGDLETAKKMIRIAVDFCGVQAVKFQKRDIEQYRTDPAYYEHRKALEFSIDQHGELRGLCASLGVDYGCSVFDEKSLSEILSLGPSYIKFGSAVNQRKDLIGIAIREASLPVHISLGMLTNIEREIIVNHARRFSDRIVLYHTTTNYPIRSTEACLLEISMLKSETHCHIGFSNHHPGVALDLVAYALGAEYIERHFTLDRTQKGTDHAASLEPDGLRKVVKYLADAADAMEYKPESGLVECEIANRKKFKGL